MLQLFTAGLFAGGVQFSIVAVTILLVCRYGMLDPSPINVGSQSAQPFAKATAFLFGFYFLIALGLALTRNRYVDATALNLRQAARRVWPANPHYAVRALQAQLLIAAAGFGILALRPVPLALVELVSAIGCAAAIPAIWPAMMSIFAAALGANAHAAAEAQRQGGVI